MFGSTTLLNAGSEDIFLAKYNANGNMLWAKSAGGTDYDYANTIKLDILGNIYIAGYYRSSPLTLILTL